MSFTNDTVASIRHFLQQMDVDADPTLPSLVITVTRDFRNGLLRDVQVDRIHHKAQAPPGVLVREALDNQ